MSDNSYTADEALAPEQPVSSRAEKISRIFIIFAVFFIAAELIWFFIISPCMPFSRVDLRGFQGISRDQVLIQAGIDAKSSYMSLDPLSAEKALAGLPQIESAQVIKIFPASVEIILTGRTALGASLVRLNGRQTLAIFDWQGVVFKIADRGDAGAVSLPLISGLNPGESGPGARLQPESFAGPFLLKLARIRDSAPELFAEISEIRVNRNTFGEAEGKPYRTFDLVLYFVHKQVKVRTEADLNEDTLRYILLTVDALIARDPRIEEIDFRSGIASYTIKEASSG